MFWGIRVKFSNLAKKQRSRNQKSKTHGRINFQPLIASCCEIHHTASMVHPSQQIYTKSLSSGIMDLWHLWRVLVQPYEDIKIYRQAIWKNHKIIPWRCPTSACAHFVMESYGGGALTSFVDALRKRSPVWLPQYTIAHYLNNRVVNTYL